MKREASADKKAWKSKDPKVQSCLVTRISQNAMVHIITCTAAAKMGRKLASVYEQKTEESIHIVQQRFFQYKFEEDTDMSTILSKIEELRNQLKKKLIITKVLMSLPNCYKHFISAW